MAKDFVVYGDAAKVANKRYSFPPVPVNKIVGIRYIGKCNATVELKDGTVTKTPKEVALKYISRKRDLWEKYLPKDFGLYVYDDTVRADEIKSIQFRYALVSLVKLNVGVLRFVPRTVSDEFEANTEDFLLRGVDQPWNDLRTFDIDFADILKVVRKSKKTARVITTNGAAVRITREWADKYEEWKRGEVENVEALGFAILSDVQSMDPNAKKLTRKKGKR